MCAAGGLWKEDSILGDIPAGRDESLCKRQVGWGGTEHRAQQRARARPQRLLASGVRRLRARGQEPDKTLSGTETGPAAFGARPVLTAWLYVGRGAGPRSELRSPPPRSTDPAAQRPPARSATCPCSNAARQRCPGELASGSFRDQG